MMSAKQLVIHHQERRSSCNVESRNLVDSSPVPSVASIIINTLSYIHGFTYRAPENLAEPSEQEKNLLDQRTFATA